jgi:hypothetical protein
MILKYDYCHDEFDTGKVNVQEGQRCPSCRDGMLEKKKEEKKEEKKK